MVEYTYQLNLITGWKKEKCPNEDSIDNTDFGYRLYPEQKQCLYLMKKAETSEFLYDRNRTKKIYYNKLCLGAPFSFGKTIVSLALIKLENTPIDRKQYSIFNNVSKYSHHNISELLIKRKKYIDTTLIIISPSVFSQWCEHIKKCNFNALLIDTYDDLELLYVNILNNSLDKYDLVLVVYRKLKHSYPLPLGVEMNWSEQSNISLISFLSTDKVWKRVMIDDFDTINLFYDLCIPAKIVWLISATNNINYGIKYKDRSGLFHTNNCFRVSAINHRINDILKDPYITDLTIKSNLSINIPKIQIYCYIFEYGSTVNQVLNNLNYSTEVCEKINSGDISGAASLLKLSKDCQSMGEFLYLLIQKNKESYNDSIKLCTRIEEFLNLIGDNDRIIIRELPRTENELVLESCVQNERVWNKFVTDVENNDQFITTIEIKALKNILEVSKENTCNFKNILNRIKRNMEDGLCGKCYCEIEDNIYILQCCNIMLCKYCMLKHNSNVFIDRCPNCIRKLDKDSFLQLPADTSLEDFINVDFKEAFNKLRDYNKTQTDDDDYLYHDLSPKEQGLIKLLKSETVDNCKIEKYEGLNMNGVIENGEIVENDSNDNKFIIFTRWQYCATYLSTLLKKYKIDNIILQGTNTKKITKLLSKFANDPKCNVLLIASNDVCSGLNLEFASHIIFYHSIRSPAVTAQIIGRCQRMGRKKSLKILALQHKNEISIFNI